MKIISRDQNQQFSKKWKDVNRYILQNFMELLKNGRALLLITIEKLQRKLINHLEIKLIELFANKSTSKKNK